MTQTTRKERWHYDLATGQSQHLVFRFLSRHLLQNSRWMVITVQETKWDAEREKACINTYAHASASQICLQNLCGQQQILRWLTPLLGPNLDPKTGPKQRPKRRNENVIQFWTPFWGPYLDPKMGSAIGEFRCCPHMLCKQICDPAA